MGKSKQNVTDDSGDTILLEVSVTKDDGTAKSLSGTSIEYILREFGQYENKTIINKTDSDSDVTITDSAGGTFEVKLDSSETSSLSGKFEHLCKITDSNNNTDTVFRGTVEIEN